MSNDKKYIFRVYLLLRKTNRARDISSKFPLSSFGLRIYVVFLLRGTDTRIILHIDKKVVHCRRGQPPRLHSLRTRYTLDIMYLSFLFFFCILIPAGYTSRSRNRHRVASQSTNDQVNNRERVNRENDRLVFVFLRSRTIPRKKVIENSRD